MLILVLVYKLAIWIYAADSKRTGLIDDRPSDPSRDVKLKKNSIAAYVASLTCGKEEAIQEKGRKCRRIHLKFKLLEPFR